MRHLSMKPRTTEVGEKEQNGSVEATNGALKRYLKQSLLIRGSADFESRGAYLTHWVNLKRERLGGKKMALVAGARKVAEAIWRLFHLGETFSFRKPFGPIPAEMLANGKA